MRVACSASTWRAGPATWPGEPVPPRGGARPCPPSASWAGFATLAWCGFTYDETTPFPGTAAILPVVATVAIIAAGEPLGRLSPAPLMRWRPVGFFGDISYSLYLWHWPPIVIVPVVLGHTMGFQARLLILVGAVLAAWGTKVWVEDPVRFTRRPALRRPLTALVATAAGAAVLVAGARVGVGTAVAVENTQQAVADAVLKDIPDCFGAAAMDPQKPCTNPELEGTMIPALAAAPKTTRTTPGASPESPAPSSPAAPSATSTTGASRTSCSSATRTPRCSCPLSRPWSSRARSR